MTNQMYSLPNNPSSSYSMIPHGSIPPSRHLYWPDLVTAKKGILVTFESVSMASLARACVGTVALLGLSHNPGPQENNPAG